MKLDSLQRQWNSLATDDAIWTILGVNPATSASWSLDEFFQTGRNDVSQILSVLASHESLPAGGRALDFGCGIGRLTQALSGSFAEVVGVDISPMMIEQASRFNSAPEKCSYRVNADDDLSAFPTRSFDLVVSRIVLQHLPRKLAEKYLSEFARVTKPGGAIVVQIPSRRLTKKVRYFVSGRVPRVASALRSILGKEPRIPMHVIPEADVRDLLEGAGCRVIVAEKDGASGTSFESLVYYVKRVA